MSNSHIGGTNSHYNAVCGVPYPQDSTWVCSRSQGHRDAHKAYWGHETASRSRFYDSWPNAGKGSASRDDVAEALASIQATMQSRMPTLAKRVAETNQALAKKYDGTNVSVQIHVQTPLRAELDEIIDRLVLLRDSLP